MRIAIASLVLVAYAQASDALVADLGSDDYFVREKAQERLRVLGTAALEPLARATGSNDPEVAIAAIKLLVQIRGRGLIGIYVREVPHGMDARKLREPPPETDGPLRPREVVVTGTANGLPGEKAGFEEGDRFRSVNGHKICRFCNLERMMALVGPGKRVMIVVERDGRKVTLTCILARDPQAADAEEGE